MVVFCALAYLKDFGIIARFDNIQKVFRYNHRFDISILGVMQMKFMANFKCNHTPSSTYHYLREFESFDFDKSSKGNAKFWEQNEVVVFPPFVALQSAIDSAKNVKIGAQNAYPTQSGAYSGEIGEQMLESIGIKTILIGHSERRNILGESQEFCAKKVRYFLDRGYEVVYCVGENLATRQAGKQALEAFLCSQFVGLDSVIDSSEFVGKFCVAYEPIWAIGTGVSAGEGDIEGVHRFLRSITSAPLLYGGSVNASNASQITQIQNVDGVLIGSAALTPSGLRDIIKACI